MAPGTLSNADVFVSVNLLLVSFHFLEARHLEFRLMFNCVSMTYLSKVKYDEREGGKREMTM